MRPGLALLLAVCVLPARAAAPPDPLAALIDQLSAPLDEKASSAPGAANENSARLAQIQAGLTVAAAGYEALRSPAHAAAAREALEAKSDPALKPFLKNRDASLDAVYRTLAVVDYTWALRFPGPACSATERRRALLQSSDGLFVDPDVGSLSPWMQKLLGPSSFGLAPEAALDQASATAKLTPSEYEKLRVKASRLTEELAGSLDGAARGKLYCERADLYEQLAGAHRAQNGPTLASRDTGGGESAASASVFLLAAPKGNDYEELGAGFLVRIGDGVEFVTDASVARGHDKIYAFARPSVEGKLGEPLRVVIERISAGPGAAMGRLEGADGARALVLATAAPAVDTLARAVGPVRAAGPWTTTQGLVTAIGDGTIRTDAALSAEMAGGPLLNENGEAAGLMIRRGDDIAVLRPEMLKNFLDGRQTEFSDAEFLASRNTGSASILTTAMPVTERTWSAPGATAIESGLPGSLGGVNWDGGGGVGGFRPTGSVGPSGYSSYSSGYDSGGWENNVGSDLGSALAVVAVAGIQRLFKGIFSLFQSHPGDAQAQGLAGTRPEKPRPPPPPPPKEKLKAVGLTLTADKSSAGTGDAVTLTATLSFTGEEGSRAGIPVDFAADGDRISFVNGKTAATNGAGVASLAVQVIGDATSNAAEAQDALQREEKRQGGEEVEAPRVVPSPKADSASKLRASADAEDDALDKEAQSARGEEKVTDSDGEDDSPRPAAASPMGLTETGAATPPPSANPGFSRPPLAQPPAQTELSELSHESRIGTERISLTANVPPGGVVDHALDAKTNLAALIGLCPPGSIAANAYGQELDALPGQRAAPDSLNEMEKYTKCDRQEVEAEMDCGDKDSACRGTRLNELGYDFKYCPGRVLKPSSGSSPGQVAFPHMRPFQYVKCVPRSSLPDYRKAYSDEGGENGWLGKKDNESEGSEGSESEQEPTTNAEAEQAAKKLGFTKKVSRGQVPFDSHGQAVFQRGNKYITRDVDSHIGGVWKMFDRYGERLGTFDADLNRIGD